MKRCSKCGVKKPATSDNFHRQKRGLYGFMAVCKTCRKLIDATPSYKQRRRERHHKPEIREARLAKNSTDEFRAKRRQYYSRPETKTRIRKEHSTPHYREMERLRAKKPSYAARARRNVAKRNTLKKGLPFTLTDAQWSRALDYFNNKCAVCGRQADFWTFLAQDHWIPLSNPSPSNPGTSAMNIVPLCHSLKGVPSGDPACNMSKKDKDATQWLIERFGKHQAQIILKRINDYFDWVKHEDSNLK
jgi:hypothetical protein